MKIKSQQYTDSAELIKAIEDTPLSDEILDISEIDLTQFNDEELIAGIDAIPEHVTQVHLSHTLKPHIKTIYDKLKPVKARVEVLFDEPYESLSEGEDVSSPTQLEEAGFFPITPELAEGKAKISWVREKNQHAILLIETNIGGDYQIQKAHMRGDLIFRDPLRMITRQQVFWGMHYRQGRVEVKDLTGKKIKYEEVLRAWDIDESAAVILLNYAKEQAKKKQYFNIFGDGALSSMFMATTLNQRSHSCVTWSREALLHAGINIPKQHLINLITITDVLKKDLHEEPMDEVAMARMTRGNYHNAIAHWYAQNPTDATESQPYADPNKLLWRATRGPSEFILGTYSPFMLACAYGHVETASLLLNDYDANPYVNSASRFCFGLFGRYSAFDCAKSLLFRPYVEREKRDEVKGLLDNVDHKPLCLAALEEYIVKRDAESAKEYNTAIRFFGCRMMGFGYSQAQKVNAAQAFMLAIDNGEPIDREHLGALSQGYLGKIFSDYQKYSPDKLSFTKKAPCFQF